MSQQPRARRSTPAGSPDTQRTRIRELRDSLAARTEQRRAAQASRLEAAAAAAAAGATIRDIVEAAGISRAYLHKVGIRAGERSPGGDPTSALEETRRLREQLADLDATDESEKDERRRIALELIDSGAGISEKELAADAGVTAEWVRRRFSDG